MGKFKDILIYCIESNQNPDRVLSERIAFLKNLKEIQKGNSKVLDSAVSAGYTTSSK